MDSLQWGASFVTGITDVDNQYKTLIAMINSFGEAIAESTIKELATYA